MSKRVEICGLDTSQLPKLKSKELQELLVKLKSGDENARSEFINANLRLVLSIVQRFADSKESADDLFQVGCVGLLKAIQNFDLSLGVMFSTYAVPMIMGEMRRFLRDSTSIKVSRNLRDTAYKALEVREKYAREGKEAELFEISKELNISEKDIAEALDAVSEPISLYETVWGEGEDSLHLIEQIFDKDATEERWTEKFSLIDALSLLPSREKEILEMRYFNGKTQVEISNEVGISQAQVSRLEKNAIKKLKEYITD